MLVDSCGIVVYRVKREWDFVLLWGWLVLMLKVVVFVTEQKGK